MVLLRRHPFFCLLFLQIIFAFILDQRHPQIDFKLKKQAYQATVVETETVSKENQKHTRLTVDVDSLTRVQLTVGEVCEVTPGSQIAFRAKILPPRSFKNPGGFHYRKYLNRRGIWGKAFLLKCDEIAIKSLAKLSWRESYRQKMIASLSKPTLAHGPILSDLILGTSFTPPDEKQMFRVAGLAHLFAISGMNFAVMGAIVYFLVSFLTRFMTRLYLYVPRQKIAAFATLIFIIFYLGIVTHQPSVLRSGIMMTFYLLAIIFNKQHRIFHVITVSAVVILLFRPLDIFDVSFQLSFLCVLCLSVVFPFFQPAELGAVKFRGQASAKILRFLHYFLAIAITSVVMGFFLAPLVLHIFGTMPLAGLLNNTWAVPYFDFIVIPLSLFYLLSFVFHLPLTPWILILWDYSLDIFIKVLMYGEKVPGLALSLPTPHLSQVVIFYVFTFWFFLTRQKRHLIFLSLGLLVSTAVIYHQNFLGFDLRITAIDVGQGDAVLVQTQEKTLLIDAGGSPYLDTGKLAVLPFLRHAWIQRLDVLAITHAHIDHYGGVTALLDTITIGEVWLHGDGQIHDAAYDAVLAEIQKRKIPFRVIDHEEKWALDNQTWIHFLAPILETKTLANENDRSLVFKISQNDFSALMTGDIMKDTEFTLTRKYGVILDSDFLKIGHHGSYSSSTERFLKEVSPKWAFIGVGEYSPYGHPHVKVVERLKRHGIKFWRTDLQGMLRLDVQDGKVTVETYQSIQQERHNSHKFNHK